MKSKLFFLFTLLLLVACRRETRYDAPGGLRYRIVSSHPDAPLAGSGATVKLRFTQKIGDSVYLSTSGNMPDYQALIPGLVPPYSFTDVLGYNIHEGDSIVVHQSLDTLLAKKVLVSSPWMQGQKELVTVLKVLRVFPYDPAHAGRTDSLLKTDKQAEKAVLDRAEYKLGLARVSAWLSQRHIPAERSPAGTWIQVFSKGTGARLQKGSTAMLKFRLKTLSGRILSSNLDTGYRQPPLLQDPLFSRVLPPAADSSLCALGKGGHAIIYIPAMRGFGGVPSGANSLRYDDLALEVIVQDAR